VAPQQLGDTVEHDLLLSQCQSPHHAIQMRLAHGLLQDSHIKVAYPGALCVRGSRPSHLVRRDLHSRALNLPR
jgi:hypothetical protein